MMRSTVSIKRPLYIFSIKKGSRYRADIDRKLINVTLATFSNRINATTLIIIHNPISTRMALSKAYDLRKNKINANEKAIMIKILDSRKLAERAAKIKIKKYNRYSVKKLLMRRLITRNFMLQFNHSIIKNKLLSIMLNAILAILQ